MILGQKFINSINTLISNFYQKLQPTDLFTGKVTSISPLKIFVDSKFTLTEEFLILSSTVKEKWLNIPEDGTYNHKHTIAQLTTEAGGSDSHTHVIAEFQTEDALPKIKLWRGLIVGDTVRLLRLHNGNLFLVLERVDGVSND